MNNLHFSTSLIFILLTACGEVDDLQIESETVLCKMSFDDDCDGYLYDVDCDDNDPNSTTLSNDPDCDGIVIGEDCDDNDELSNAIVLMLIVMVQLQKKIVMIPTQI